MEVIHLVAEDKQETTTVDLSQTYSYQGETYGPGEGVEVPKDAQERLEELEERAGNRAADGRRFNAVAGGGPVEELDGVVVEKTGEDALGLEAQRERAESEEYAEAKPEDEGQE